MIATTVAGGRTKAAVWLALGVLVALALLDVGSVVLTRMRVDDDLKSAGFAGATAIQNQPVSTASAQAAYGAAAAQLNAGESIVRESFAVRADGGITLTVRRTAPTVVMKHLSFLDGFTQVEDTYEQARIGY
ncbi:hypothetical protein [Nocardioides litoris]|uniref:hypothetical protein n=1 Tax=Nocardioides litoris TaxID=1926648 RepID=UPI0011236C95|nr:hypothetical protein [Nocardioides litoris]